jgi:osmoprotectant transport system permease protein
LKGYETGVALLTVFTLCVVASAQRIVVGSKKFTESYVLGEIAKTALQNAGFPVDLRQGMGGTIILWEALQRRDITLYPEYTGTIDEEILKTKQALSSDEMAALLRQRGVGMTKDLGFNNTYVGYAAGSRSQPESHTIGDLRSKLPN